MLRGNKIGVVTSGGFSPTVQTGPVIVAYVDAFCRRSAAEDQRLMLRGTPTPVTVVAMPLRHWV